MAEWLRANLSRSKPDGHLKMKPSRDDLVPFRKDENSVLTFEEFVAVASIAKKRDLEPKSLPLFPFDPDSKPKQLWDVLIMSFLMYTTFSVPYMLSFGEGSPNAETEATEWDAYNIFDLALDVLFCSDVIVNFCTAFVRRGVYITNMYQIAINYLQTWFLIDFFGSVPFDKIVTALSPGSESGALGALRLVRMLKIMRAARFLQKLNQLEQK